MNRRRLGVLVAVVGLTTASLAGGAADAGPAKPVVIVYDSFSDGDGYTLADYGAHWSNGFGLGELSDVDTRQFDNDSLSVSAVPFETTADFSVFDHVKYLATSNRSFAIPTKGSITFSAEIAAETPGTEPGGRRITGVYGPSGCADDPVCSATAAPYEATVLEGQQAGATLHMVDFKTGQLFDWFVSGTTAFALIERLPDSVIHSGFGGTRDTMYTQIIKEVPIGPGPHRVSIRLWRDPGKSYVEYHLDGQRVARVEKIGVPLDVQKKAYTGIYPSLGDGEVLTSKMEHVTIGHGLFSLLDAFPFQHPDAPELSVSISPSQRIFGQGARAVFDDFIVTIDASG